MYLGIDIKFWEKNENGKGYDDHSQEIIQNFRSSILGNNVWAKLYSPSL